MKHLRKVTTARALRADIYADFLNAVWQAWTQFLYAKKNELL